MLVSKQAVSYRKQVGLIVKTCVSARDRPIKKPIALVIVAHPPDKRKRDIDNLLKATLDAMEIAGLYVNDNQVHEINIKWGSVQRIASLEVMVTVLQGNNGRGNRGKKGKEEGDGDRLA